MWQLAEAKNKFSEVFTRAMTEGPQRVRRRGETVVVLSRGRVRALGGRPAEEDDRSASSCCRARPSKVSISSAIARPGARSIDFDE